MNVILDLGWFGMQVGERRTINDREPEVVACEG
jgi:hypothetical protein